MIARMGWCAVEEWESHTAAGSLLACLFRNIIGVPPSICACVVRKDARTRMTRTRR